MTAPRFQIVHYVPNLFLGGKVPVAAIVHHEGGKRRVLVRAEFHPDARCLGGHGHSVALQRALARIEREPDHASTSVLGPHIQVDELRSAPHGVEVGPWLREHVLPRLTNADSARAVRRATCGYKWLADQGLSQFVRKRFKPEKPDVPRIPQLENKNLKTVSHWATDGTRLLLMEPIVPRDLQQNVVEEIATIFGAYRFHLSDTTSVTLAAYMLEGGGTEARIHTRRALSASAHRVFDTQHADQRAELIEQVRKIATGIS